MSELAERIASLTPQQRELLALRLKQREVDTTKVAGIPRRATGEHAPLSFAQQRLWFLEQLEPGSAVYNIAITISLAGRLNVDALRRSFDEVVRRHEILRTTFVTVDDKAVQSFAPSLTLPLPVSDLTSLPQSERRVEAFRLAAVEAQQPFHLATGPLLRISLIRLAEDEHFLLLTMHHIVSDGWSMGVFMHEVTTLYVAYADGRDSPLTELPIQYADYAVWQRDWLSGQRLVDHLSYWKQQLTGASALELPTDRPRPRLQTFSGARHPFRLPRSLSDSLLELGRREQATLFMTLLAAFQVLLSRYSGQTDISVGTPVAGRTRTEAEGLIGLFVNTLVVRGQVSGGESFAQVLGRVREACVGAQQHQELPFEQLVDALQPERTLNRHPLFDVVFVLQNTSIPSITLPGLTLKQVPIESGAAKFDLTLEVEETPDGLGAAIEYNADLFDAETVRRMAEHFETLLEGIAADPHCRIAELPLLPEAERRQLLVEWNDTAVEYAAPRSLHRLFEEQVARTPDREAVVFKDERLTYAELNGRADGLARELRRLGVGSESLVGVLMERSTEMVVALLGILKAGGAYLPLDPGYPPARLSFMLADARPSVLLTQRRLLDSLPAHEAQVVCLDAAEALAFESAPEDGGSAEVDGHNLAYVIYTSGSTGEPKGAMNTHRGIVNRLLWMQAAYGLTPDDVVLQKTPFSFDVSVWEFFWPLITGARLVLAEPGGHQDPAYLVRLIKRQGVTTIHFVPSMLQPFLAEADPSRCATLRRVICSGEALSLELEGRFHQRFGAELHNLYGPTEAAVDVTHWACERGNRRRSVPIGRPISNIRVYILDGQLRPVPVGVAGELYLGGEGLARGYHGRPALTAEKFVPDPFSTEPGARLYRTGDLTRFSRDGAIEYLGRLDHQVKIRGFRIELGEIEATLKQHAGIQEATVVSREHPSGGQRLVAYLVPDGERAHTARQLARFEREGVLAEKSQYELPDGSIVLHQNKGETDFLYQEIFEEEGYLKYGVSLRDGDCVFDVGANIGMFTLFVGRKYANSVVYAFEPLPPLFDLLRLNAALYDLNVRLFECGLSSEARSDVFNFYKHCSLISGRYADATEEKDVVKAFMRNERHTDTPGLTPAGDELIDELLADRLTSETFTCELKTLSDVIAENNIERIDLLKIDVEKSEQDVLAGLRESDWPKVRQMVVEIHDIENRLEQITAQLRGHGFDFVIEQDDALKNTPLYNVYAVRPTGETQARPDDSTAEPATNVNWTNPKTLIGDVRDYLKERLPEYMVPAAFVLMDELPLSSNGKVDRRALPSPDTSKSLAEKSYVAPGNAAEEQLANIWAEVLGVKRVGIHDNFFELGGDSILSIQIISRANRAGLRLTPKQMFEFQTVCKLAAAAGSVVESEAMQEAVAGTLPLTPAQSWFFERDLPEPHHFNQSVLLEVPADVEASVLEKSVARVLEHHDALRLRFVQGESGWLQENAAEETQRVFSLHDLSGIREDERAAALETTGAGLQASLDLARGPLVRVALFVMGEGLASRLLVVAHHLTIDGVSWRILLEDLQSVYEQLQGGAEVVVLPPKTTSYKQWAEAIREHAQTEEVRRELDYWAGVVGSDGLRSLPIEQEEAGHNGGESAQTLTVSLGEDETRALLQKVPEAYRAQANDALLSALAVALAGWAGAGKFLVSLEGHGREEISPSLDVSRTVGWFTSIFPVALEARAGEAPGDALKRVKEQLRRIPQRGFGYGLLKYLNEDEAVQRAMRGARTELSFNYLGQFDQVLNEGSLFRAAREAAGRAVSARSERAHVLEIDALVAHGSLQVNVTYSSQLHRREAVERFAQGYLQALRRLIAHCQEAEAGGFTPSDFPLARLEQQEIDHVTGGGDRNVENVYPLSPMQQGLFFHTLYEPHGGAYVVQLSYEIAGRLNAQALKGAWERVVARHAALRAAFVWENLDEPVQVVRRRVEIPLTERDWRALPTERQQRQLAEFIEEDRRRGFDLGHAPLMRLSLVRLADERHYVTWSHHHILLDGWCMPILLEEVFSLYEALRRGEDVEPAPARPYSDYIAWLQRQEPSGAEAFWRETLAGFTAPTPLPAARLGDDADDDGGTNYEDQEMTLAASTTEALREAARNNRVTLNTIMQGAWALLLGRYSGERDVLFGVTVSGRPAELPGIESMIGLFINTLPLRVQVQDEETVADWLRRLHKRQVEMQQYEFSPLVEVQGWGDVPRGTPMFDSILVFENYPVGALAGRLNEQGVGLEVQSIHAKEQTNYPLTVYAAPGDGFFVRMSYDRARFEADAIRRLLEHLRLLLEAIVADPEQRISQLPSLTGEERQRVLVEFNETRGEYPRDVCVHELFEQQAARTPDACAVVFADVRLSYRQLNERADKLAQRLRELGVGTESLVGVLLGRSAELVVALLGVLKAGAAYVPLDPDYPRERLEFMLSDSGARVLLTEEALRARLPHHAAHVLCVDSDHGTATAAAAAAADGSVSSLSPRSSRVASSGDLAYIIYTSGSTGTPKGVAVSHAAVVNFLWHMRREPGLCARDTLLAVTTLSFDIAALELYLPLAVGARLVIADRETASDARLLRETLAQGEITAMQATPTTWRMLVEAGWDGGRGLKVLCGGEALNSDLAEQLVARSAEVWNLYGPTETTIWSAAWRVRAGALSIGRPISNTRVYMLDERMQPAPIGVAGELYIGGDGVAQGYLNRPALTAEKFVPDPFNATPGARLYRTGDAARWQSNGEIEYLGRLDHQVKIRGFRIELGEIETTLNRHPSITSAVVIAREETGGGKHLVAYLVASDGADAPGVGELRAHLAGQLPDYMIPSAFVVLESLPRTPNGKIDRRALPAPEGFRVAASAEYVAPRTGVEAMLADLWASALGIERVGVHDNFFELGGHSLTATRLVSRVRETFNVELSLRELFEHPTIGALAESIERALKSGAQVGHLPPVVRVARDGALPLSFAQQRLWFLDQLEGGISTAYNVPAALRLSGTLDVEALSRALAEVMRRHEVLRTTFSAIDGRPVQAIAPPLPSTSLLPLVELAQLPQAEREGEVRRLAVEEAREPFDLAAGPLLRARLLRLSAEEHVALFTMHHIVCDAWSLGVLVREVAELYEAFSHGRPSPLPELAVQYTDFAAWQQEWLSGAALESQLTYWKGQLGGELPVLELPADRPRPAVPTRRGGTQNFVVPDAIGSGLKRLSRGAGVTLYMTLLAAFKTLLHRYTNQTDIIVGTPVANRSREELEPLIGFFANTLVLRTDLAGDPTFRELLRRVREVALGAYAHEDMPFEKLVAELQPTRDMSRSPLFNVLFSLQNAPQEALELSGLRLAHESTGNQTTKFDLVVNLFETGGRLEGSVEYDTDLFEDATISRLLSHLQVLLEGIVEDPARRLSEFALMGYDERRRALVEFNDTRADYEQDACLHQLFERQAARTPDATALTYEGQHMTYAGLNARSNQLARHLLASGAGHGALVGVCLEHSFETFVALLGVLKAGAAYVPLEPAHPRHKLASTLAGARVAVLLTQLHLKDRLADLLPTAAQPHVLCLDSEWGQVAVHDIADLPPLATNGDTAYILYTSGSTGEPKGVVVTHASAVNYVAWAREMYMPEREPISCAFYSSLAFDLTVTSVFAPLAGGHRVVIYRRAGAAGVPLLELFDDNQVEVLKLTPSHLALVKTRDNSASRIRRLVVGGEALTVELSREVTDSFGGAVEIYNEYGPTEATVGCMIHRYAPELDTRVGVPIGRPAANTQIYVLDERMRHVAGGVRGELYLGGVGVARGYLNRPSLTAGRFVPDPFSAEPGARLYRTGDLARRLAEGALEYLGRGDEQVKYHGHRVELGEISSALNEHPQVTDSVAVVTKDADGVEVMAAYYVSQGEIMWSELRAFLAERVVQETLPSVYVHMSQLPLTLNGKVDRDALPAPETARPTLKEIFVAPRTPTEEMLAGVWAKTLHVERVGVHDNFFELGGHSLLATQLVSRVREAFNVDLALRSLFERPTVAALAETIEEAMLESAGLTFLPLRPSARTDGDELPLSFAQQRLWFLDQLEPGTALYNIPAAVRLRGTLDLDALKLSFGEIVRRHESLRTTFAAADGQPRQIIAPPAKPHIAFDDLSHLDSDEREAGVARLAEAEAQRPFDLAAGPLLRLRVLRLAEREHVLTLTMHHIISDGWSMGVLIREVVALYEAHTQGQPSPLPELPVQYADYAAWQREWLHGEVLERQLSYWRGQLAGAPVLELPADKLRPAVQSYRGASAGVTLDAELTRSLRELGWREGATLFMTLLAAFQLLLSRYTNQTDISVGSPIAGRTRAETEGLIGLFLNTLVLRTKLDGDPTFRELLVRVREVALAAYTHQDVPFERLVEELQPERDLGHSPLFQVMFNHLNFTSSEIALPDLIVQPLTDASEHGAKFDLALYAAEEGDELNLTLVYKTDLFDASTIASMCDQLRTLLESVAADPGQLIGNYSLLSDSEQFALISDFNE